MNMNSFTINGLILCIGGGFSLLFQWISKLMEKPEWDTIFLSNLSYDMWVTISEKLPVGLIQNGFDYLVFELPLWILLFTLGGLCILAGSFIKQ
ncbi:MAG: hypothetical protein HQK70_06095 [Desulfamplus sp.]|nr:hypothetical protein [Desulfamplus sp.]